MPNKKKKMAFLHFLWRENGSREDDRLAFDKLCFDRKNPPFKTVM